MKTTDYESLALDITKLQGKYIGQGKVKLEDGSVISFGTISALRIINNRNEYTSILYEETEKGWRTVSLSTEMKNTKVSFGLVDLRTIKEISEEYDIPSKTLQQRLELPGFGLIENIDFKKLGDRQPTLLTPSGIEKIIKK